MTRLLVLVPARGGSKRLPGKNIALLSGRSLLAWTAECLSASVVSAAPCLLSTDDDRIRSEGLRLGWQVPWLRPSSLATDAATTLDVAIHALDWWRNEYGADPDLLLLLQPTSPFRRASSLDAALKMFEDGEADAVIGVSGMHRTPRTLFSRDDKGFLVPLGKGESPTEIFTPNGSIYLIRSSALRAEKTFFPANTVGMKMSELEAIDIDTPEDWEIASILAKEI